MARIVHRLVGEPAREGAVSHYRDHFELLADQIARRGDAVCGREAGPRVPGPELIVRTLAAPQEPGQAARLAQRRQAIVATGEDLPGVALMAHIPHDLVAGRVEAVAERHGQLDHAQAGADVTAGLGDDVDQPSAHLVREGLQPVAPQAPDVCGTYDRLKERHGALSGAECGMRSAECPTECRPAIDLPLQFRIPHSAFRILLGTFSLVALLCNAPAPPA